MENNVKIYLKSQINERIARANIFEDKIVKDRKEATTLQKEVRDYKRNNLGKPIQEIKDKLIKTQELYYYSELIERQLVQEVELVKSFSTMANILKIDLELTDAEKEIVNHIMKMDNNWFLTNSEGEVFIPNEESKRLIEEGLSARTTSDKSLNELYGMIPV